MGWNDRLPEDPYTPPESFYRDRDDYEAWLEYVEEQLNAEEQLGLTSQNIDPQTISNAPQEAPRRQTTLSRIWAKIFGKEVPTDEVQPESKSDLRKEDSGIPF